MEVPDQELADVVAFSICEQRIVTFSRVREMADHNVNQIVNTGACLAGNEAGGMMWPSRECPRSMGREE